MLVLFRYINLLPLILKYLEYMLSIAVLGTGSSSLAFLVKLLNDKDDLRNETVRIDVIDFGSRRLTDSTYRAPGMAGKPLVQKPDALYIPPLFHTVSKLSGEIAGSSSFGGWSNIWGATVEKYPDSHTSLWGDEKDSLYDSYRFLEEKFPHFRTKTELTGPIKRLLPSSLAEPKIVDTITEHFQQKASSLAIEKFSDSQEVGCNQCGLCLEGCPANHIWSSTTEWGRLFRRDNVKSVSNVWIERIVETAEKVSLITVNTDESRTTTEYDRIFIGLGSLQTSSLLLRSEISTTDEIRIKDSKMVLVPLIKRNFSRTGDEKPRIALCDGFVTVTDQQDVIGKNEFFSQIYCFSSSMQKQLEQEFSFLKLFPKRILSWSLSRFAIAMCFFDQDLSGEISITTKDDKVFMTPIKNVEKFRSLRRVLARSFKFSDFKPLTHFSKPSPVGLGYHFGASFPMSNRISPDCNSSDIYGRPNGLSRIHIIDSTVLPRISAFPITFTTMANAVRIASHFDHFKDSNQ